MSVRRLVYRYLFWSGVLLNLVLAGVYLHYRSTGVTPHRYVSKVVQVLDRDSSPTRHIADALRRTLLDTGVIADPVDEYPPDLTTELPPWRGDGASQLRVDTWPRYASDGRPIATTESDLWLLTPPSQGRDVAVDTVEALIAALGSAQPGDRLLLKAGIYHIDRSITLGPGGSAHRPLIIRGEQIGSVVLSLADGAQIAVEGGYWTISDLIIRGPCDGDSCDSLIRAGATADALALRNLFVSGGRDLLEAPFAATTAHNPLVDGVTLVGCDLSTNGTALTERSVRQISIPQTKDGFVVVCPGDTPSATCDTDSLSKALQRVTEDGLILLRSGAYRQAAIIAKKNVHLLAEPGARLVGQSVGGKGALVARGNITIEGLECSHVKVSDGNGCCVRQEQGDLTLLGVHFHHSQMGLLTGHNGGRIRVIDSYFHDSGYDESGALGHNLYINSGTLEFVRSISVAARNGGHEVKSRAAETLITDSFLASLNARDSRLVDAPNGGVLEIRGTVLGEGPRSENWDIVGYGLEIGDNPPKHTVNRITLRNNTVYADRPQSAQLLNAKHAETIDVSDNIIIGNTDAPRDNTFFGDRSDAGVPPYPALKLLSIH